jgi:hypothetical protein
MRSWRLGILIVAALAAASLLLWNNLRERPEDLDISTGQWRADLRYLARELPKRHANAFHFTPREAFEKAVADLDRQLAHANGDEAWVGMQRLVSFVGDAHTYLRTPRDDANFAMDIKRFGSDYRVVDIDPRWKNAIGTRVIRIGEVPVERASELAHELYSRDENPPSADSFVEGVLTTGAALHGLGITSDRNQARYTLLEDSGNEFTIDVRSGPPSGELARPFQKTPLYLQNTAPFTCTYLGEASTLYCNIRAILDLKTPSKEMFETIEQKHPQKLAIDLRRNRGGDNALGEKCLVRPLSKFASINQKGHLFVLISADTFSAAMNNASQFRTQTAALLVGQEIGEKPNSYQEPRNMTLPNSHLTIRYSTDYYRFATSAENAIRPDQEIVPSWTDYQAGRDPVLEWVLKYPTQ